MIIEVVNALRNEETKRLEVVKEVVDDDGNVSYALHIIPITAINEIAAVHDINNPDEAVDLVLFEPHLSEDDDAPTLTERIAKCKDRLSDKSPDKARRKDNRKQNMEKQNLHPRFLPILGTDPINDVKLLGNVTTENITKKRKELQPPKEKENGRPEQRPDEEGREGPRRKNIFLGTTSRRR